MQAAAIIDEKAMLKFANEVVAQQKSLFHTKVNDPELHCLLHDQSEFDGYDATTTSLLLQELTATCLTRMGEDPLSKFETKVAFVDGFYPVAKYSPKFDIIVFSKPLLHSLEFLVAQAAFTNLSQKIRKRLIEKKEDPHNLVQLIDTTKNAIYSLVQARLILHSRLGRPLPKFAELLPKAYRPFLKQQLELCLSFILLHEQAHREFYKGKAIEALNINLDQVVLETLSQKKREEFAADHWAIKQVIPGSRVPLMKAGVFFFFNIWSFDYLQYEQRNDHPASFNRIQALVNSFPKLKAKDAAFFTIFANDLDRQHNFMQKLHQKTARERGGSLLRYCEQLADFDLFEDLVSALSQTYDELHA
ncbi:MAG: hypothetical protein Mars2KO_05080 [Maribacter sp.]